MHDKTVGNNYYLCPDFEILILTNCFFFKITVDPVELWASPTSQSRQEKDYFDSRFGPFYRTEQIFFKPYNQEGVKITVLGLKFTQ